MASGEFSPLSDTENAKIFSKGRAPMQYVCRQRTRALERTFTADNPRQQRPLSNCRGFACQRNGSADVWGHPSKDLPADACLLRIRPAWIPQRAGRFPFWPPFFLRFFATRGVRDIEGGTSDNAGADTPKSRGHANPIIIAGPK